MNKENFDEAKSIVEKYYQCPFCKNILERKTNSHSSIYWGGREQQACRGCISKNKEEIFEW